MKSATESQRHGEKAGRIDQKRQLIFDRSFDFIFLCVSPVSVANQFLSPLKQEVPWPNSVRHSVDLNCLFRRDINTTRRILEFIWGSFGKTNGLKSSSFQVTRHFIIS